MSIIVLNSLFFILHLSLIINSLTLFKRLKDFLNNFLFDFITEFIAAKNPKLVAEIGCNDTFFLKKFIFRDIPRFIINQSMGIIDDRINILIQFIKLLANILLVI